MLIPAVWEVLGDIQSSFSYLYSYVYLRMYEQICSTENAQSVKNVTCKDKKRAIRMKFPNLYQPVVGKETNKKESTKKNNRFNGVCHHERKTGSSPSMDKSLNNVLKGCSPLLLQGIFKLLKEENMFQDTMQRLIPSMRHCTPCTHAN